MFNLKKVLITAGPTYEPIDPVRFIGNRSSGKMGYELAKAFLNANAQVILVSGPVNLSLSHQNLNLIKVETAQEMYIACKQHFPTADIAVFAAAVADYTPIVVQDQKIKKQPDNEHMVLQLKKTTDILAELSKAKSSQQCVVGFSLETENALENARKKLVSKKCNLIVLNTLEDEGAGFARDTNKIYILSDRGDVTPFPLKSKTSVALDVLEYISNYIQ